MLFERGKKVKKQARQFVFRYNGDPTSDEVVPDLEAEVPIPEAGNTVERNGKNWRVVHIIKDLSAAGAIPVVRVFLSDTP
jgi:hypothetical protein